jgi:hypothetical protein
VSGDAAPGGDVAECLFFGCWGRPGHGLFASGGRPSPRHRVFDLGWELDGTLAPKRSSDGVVFSLSGLKPDERYRLDRHSTECPQGQYLVHLLDWPLMSTTKWAAASWWDRCQGDDRAGCNSTVLLEGGHSAEEVVQALRDHFPTVLGNLARAGVELRPVPANA